MRIALQQLDRLIVTTIAPAKIKKAGYDTEQIDAWSYAAINDCGSIQEYLLHNDGENMDRDSLEILIRNYQSDLVYLSDMLYKYRRECTEPLLVKLYDNIGNGIEALLYHLKFRRKDFFNKDGKAPDKDQQRVRQSLQEVWPALRSRMQQLAVHGQLAEIALEPVSAFLEGHKAEHITYRLLDYLKEFSIELDRWGSRKWDDPDWELICLLMQVNFNSPAFCSWCNSYLTELVYQTTDLRERLARLEVLYKEFHFRLPRPEIAFEPRIMPVKAYLENWIATQKISVKKEQELLPPEKAYTGAKKAELNKKLRSAFTVEERGLWARMEMETEIIENTNMTEVMKTLAQVYETAQQSNISSRSMSWKSKAVELHSFERVMEKAKQFYINLRNYGKNQGYDVEKWYRKI